MEVAARYPAAARELCEEIGHRQGCAALLNDLGEARSALADTAAECLHQEAAALARDLGSHLEGARALAGLGRYRRSRGETGLAAGLLQRAPALFARIGAAEQERPAAELNDLRPAGRRPADRSAPGGIRATRPPPSSGVKRRTGFGRATPPAACRARAPASRARAGSARGVRGRRRFAGPSAEPLAVRASRSSRRGRPRAVHVPRVRVREGQNGLCGDLSACEGSS
ncbi:hypothetical protein GCM10010282_37020 [Streptomyces roseolus]|nr:hypothetical protein GCM10010282_37020 [Streptomyces roseolus]